MELEAMLATVQDELEQKDRAIIELADLLEVIFQFIVKKILTFLNRSKSQNPKQKEKLA